MRKVAPAIWKYLGFKRDNVEVCVPCLTLSSAVIENIFLATDIMYIVKIQNTVWNVEVRASVKHLVSSSVEVADSNHLNTPRRTLYHSGREKACALSGDIKS